MLKKPEIYSRVDCILHFPQYLSYLLTGEKSAEHSSIGCHTALWDFDTMNYHSWINRLGDVFPQPVTLEQTFPSRIFGRRVPVGVGIHDSSASLVPYFLQSGEPFILVSTGTWCISMNPFNEEPLTTHQLQNDCLSYMSVRQKPVKSSRLFMGKIHDENVQYLSKLYNVGPDSYKKLGPDEIVYEKLKEKYTSKVFFANGVPEDYIDRTIRREQFDSFEEAYHQLMIDLGELTAESIELIIPEKDDTTTLYVSGGFSKNSIFIRLLEEHFPGKTVCAYEVGNATSMGAAIVLWKGIDPGFTTKF